MLPVARFLQLVPLLALATSTTACGGTVVFEEDGGDGGGGASGSSVSGSPTGSTGSGSITGGTTSGGTGSGTTSGGSTGSGGGVGSSGVSTTSSGGVVSSSSGSAFCISHDDCTGDICQFHTGTCIRRCEEDGSCGTGEICDGCASSSCPQCADCLAGCVPAPQGVCDSHDDCGFSELCVFGWGACMPACSADGTCPPGSTCDTCATSSCPGCRDCAAACLPLEG